MSRWRLSGVQGFLRDLVGRHGSIGHTDAQLIDRFVADRDESAFASLLERYGPVVWGVCRRVLRHEQDAEDAFQATFLVLARGARSVRRRDSVRAWLHGVALKVALRAKVRRDRRQVLERAGVEVAMADPTPIESADDAGSILDEEVRRLPEKYRVPFVLCCLEGKTGDQAALEIGCPRGTVATRLARARQRLRERLSRRGLDVPEGAPAMVPPAVLAAATKGPATPAVWTLTEEVLRDMFVSKLKMWAVALFVAVVVMGGGAIAFQKADAPPPSQKKAPQPAAKEREDIVTRLMKRKFEVASAGLKAAQELFLGGRTTPDDMYYWSKRCLEAEREMNSTPAGQQAALEAHLGRMKQLEEVTTSRYDAGRAAMTSKYFGEFARVEAELWLARHKGK